MLVTLDEMKSYLRVDFSEDDELLQRLISAAERLCMEVARVDEPEKLAEDANAKAAVMYTTAYLYEHREEADHHALTLTLRALLFGIRKAGF